MGQKQSFDDYRVSDAFWARIAPLLPSYPVNPLGGRPRANLRNILDAIFYCLRTGCQWKAIPPQLAPGSTAHAYFQEWVALGVFEDIWALALQEYDDLVGLDFEWQSADGAMTKSPLGGENTGKNPTDRGKLGSKRSLLTEQAGIPIGLATAGANVPDKKLLEQTLEQSEQMVPEAADTVDQNLCLDKGYDYPDIRELVEEVYHYTAHIRSRGEEARELRHEAGEKARRWVSERCHSWLNRFRRILVRWEKKTANYFALLEFACAFITFQRAGVFG